VTVADPILSLRDLRVTYYPHGQPVHAVRGVSLAIQPGVVFGLVGESGCGKSSVALAVMGGVGDGAVVSGEVIHGRANLLAQSERQLRRLWGRRLAMVFQDAPSTLNPVLTVGDQVMEILLQHDGGSRPEGLARMMGLFDAVGLPVPSEIARRYPHQLSGGQQQRIAIAMALACDPDLLIMDEPTTGLDVTTEARIVDLVASLCRRSRAATCISRTIWA
jgi:peptide/nickel transport system ATP-binding protein